MDKEKIIARIRKLLALAGSPVPEEAAAAMAKAQELMAEYAIEQEALDLSEMAEVVADFRFSKALRPAQYVVNLGWHCAEVFGVDHIWGGNGRISFLGDKGRADLAAYSFTVLGRQCAKARRSYFESLRKRIKRSTRIGRADQFARGWVHTATRTLPPFGPSEKEQTLIAKFKEQKYPHTETLEIREKKAVNGKDDAFFAGFSEGRNARLEAALNGGAANPTLQLGS